MQKRPSRYEIQWLLFRFLHCLYCAGGPWHCTPLQSRLAVLLAWTRGLESHSFTMGLITITSILGGLTCTQAYIIRNSSSTSVQRPPPSPRLISLSEDAAFDDPRVWHRALNDAPASN